MNIRRIVTGRNSEGRSFFAAADAAPNSHDFVHNPGMSLTRIWSTPPIPALAARTNDPTLTPASIVSPPGGTYFILVSFPPDAVAESPQFDGRAFHEENLKVAPGLAECFEPENPGMHTTDTIDYGVVLEGEIWLELDDGRTQHLRPHDVVVQNGTRHAWRNKTDRPALMAFVLIGARRA
ncbi:MAG TPA: cupin domain-containing protein [Steroidobacteraceae bacterium]|nr:cupin domain-containing protein [Steroidobacteraceae bacterium]